MGWIAYLQLLLLLVVVALLVMIVVLGCIDKLFTQRTILEMNQRDNFRAFRDTEK